MNARDEKILKLLLQGLKDLDGQPAVETLLHATIVGGVSPTVTLAEFESAIKLCDRRKYTVGVISKVTGRTRWTIADAGEAALTEL